MSEYHKSVFLTEVIDALNVRKDEAYIDATLGGGGHTVAILEKGGRVLAIDADEEALLFVKKNYQLLISNYQLKVAQGNFKDIDTIAREHGFITVAGILFDLGVSSHQFDSGERGFSFQHNGPLDMRMDNRLSVTAKDLINGLSKGELYELFTKLGEERFSRSIANSIVSARRITTIETTHDLETIIKRVVPRNEKGINPATRIFQALRIAVNDELHVLEEALPKAIQLLSPKGRLAVISFHSLEDRIVKNILKKAEEAGQGIVITKKPIFPTEEETEINKRSRSAKLRIFEKI